MLKPYQRAEVQFEFVREIGQDGRNSRTYVVQDHQLNAEIVYKQLLKARLASPDEFFAECQALHASAHPNVVQVLYGCHDADHVYVAMPFYPNGSVKGLMAQRHLTVREIIVLGTQTLAGLHNIHSKGLIHFDIKPDNILLSLRNEAMVSDFGQAKQMNFSGIAAQDRHYGRMMPPEGMDTDHFDKTFDIYQMGLTLYRMANGNQHFYDQFAKYGPADAFDREAFRFDVRNGRFPDRRAFLHHVPSTLRNVIRKCLQTDPAQRYQSALDVANAMAGIDGECLDWQFSVTAAGKVWTKAADDKTIEVIVDDDGNCVGYKSVNGGAKRRIGDACVPGIKDADLRKLFAEL